jgi:hypothetical protein
MDLQAQVMSVRRPDREFAVVPPPHDPRFMVIPLVLLPMLIGLGVLFTVGPRAHAPVLLATLASAGTIFIAAFGLMFWAVQRRRIALSDGVLDITATLYRRRLPLAAIDLDKAQVLDLDAHREWRPLLKTNGLGLPGLRAGWYRSHDFTRMFCLLTTWNRVLVLPEHAGGALLLSAERPQDLLLALRETADAPHRAS